jgi:hypothetical protein
MFSAVYTAFLFAQAKGRDFWQSHLAPYQMAVHSMLAGGAGVILMTGVVSTEFAFALSGLQLLNLGIFASELTSSKLTNDAQKAAGMILSGRYSLQFWTAVALSRVVPLIIFFTGLTVLPIEVVAAVMLIGILVTEHIWIRVPQLIPLS